MAKLLKPADREADMDYVNHICNKVVIYRYKNVSRFLVKTRFSLLITGFPDVENPVETVDNSLQCYYFSQLCYSE